MTALKKQKFINIVPLPDDLTAAVALRIISRRFTEREPKALVITLIDSSPKLLLLLFPSSMQNHTYIYKHIDIYVPNHKYINHAYSVHLQEKQSTWLQYKPLTKHNIPYTNNMWRHIQ